MQEIDKYARENVAKLLVGNKSDLASKRLVETQAGKDMADKLNIKFLETSAAGGQHVEHAFMTMAQEIKSGMEKIPLSGNEGMSVSGPMGNQKSGCC